MLPGESLSRCLQDKQISLFTPHSQLIDKSPPCHPTLAPPSKSVLAPCTCGFLDEGRVTFEDQQEGGGAMVAQVEQDLQHLGSQQVEC